MMYYPDVPALEPDELELLCHEYLEHNATLDPHLADQMGVKRGLRNLDGTGVLAGITNVSNVIGYDKKEDGTIVPIPGRLVYRGIDIDTLAAEADAHDRFMFEEVIWLLLFGSLPTQEQYAKFRKLLEHHRELPQVRRARRGQQSAQHPAPEHQPDRRAAHDDGQRLPDQAPRL